MSTFYVVDPKGNLTAFPSGGGSADLSSLDAGNLVTGTIPDARFPATLPASSGVNLTALNASNLASGTIPVARISSLTNTQIDAAAAIAWTKLSKSGSSLADLATRSAADLSSGTLAVARLASGVITKVTTTSTGAQADFAPGLAGDTLIICNNATDLTISGFAGGVDGQRLILVSTGAGHVFLKHQNTGSVIGNRLINFATSGDTPLATGAGTAIYVYDATATRWRLIAHNQGNPITPTFAAGNFTANGSMTWTVGSGDVQYMAYFLEGRVLTVWCNLATTTVGGTLNNQLNIAVPAGFTPSAFTATNAGCRITDNGTETIGLVFQQSSNLTVMRYPSLTNFSASTDATTVQFTFTLPVS